MEEITDITDQLEMLEEVSEYADNTAAAASLKIERNVNPVKKMQGGIGHWAVYYTSPQSFILKFSYSMT